MCEKIDKFGNFCISINTIELFSGSVARPFGYGVLAMRMHATNIKYQIDDNGRLADSKTQHNLSGDVSVAWRTKTISICDTLFIWFVSNLLFNRYNNKKTRYN